MGEDVGVLGGAFGVSRAWSRSSAKTASSTPLISEAGYVGLCAGAALMGMRPIAELMFSDFMPLHGPARQPGGQDPVYVRRQSGRPDGRADPGGAGTGAAAQHSQSLEGLVRSRPRPQGGHALHPLRREGSPPLGRRRPEHGPLLRTQASVQQERGGARGTLPRPDRRGRG